jgi:hypothetical protein
LLSYVIVFVKKLFEKIRKKRNTTEVKTPERFTNRENMIEKSGKA